MKRNYFFYCFIIIVCAACQSEKLSNSQKKQLPNILFILTDDQGWGDLSINGNTNLSTPNIDAIGKNGAIFDRFYVAPVCSPTRAEILTGRYNPRGGVYSTSAGGERLNLDETTIADIFKKAGYKTGAFGKWHNGMQYPYHPNGRGFEEFYGFCSGHWGNYYSPMLEHNGDIIKGNGFLPDDLTEQAMQFMETNKDQPFFAYLPYNTPHSPMQVPDRWWNKFKDKPLEMRHRNPESEEDLHLRAALAMCENIDWNVGRLMEKLKQLNLEENTIIVYLSDNGPNGNRWNGGMKGKKGSTDEGGVRSPLMLQWKGKIEAGKAIPQIASAIDFLPTLTELANIPYETNKPLDGKSLKPLLLEENPAWEERLLFNYFRGKLSVRNQRFRLDNENQLFDIENDLGQKKDVTTNFPAVSDALKTAKMNWTEEVLSELPKEDLRPFLIGHPDFKKTQIPARDAFVSGKIERSNRWPNCSFFTNWTNLDDQINWNVEVVEDGTFEVIIYYTCKAENIGSTFEVRCGKGELQGQITEAHDPPLVGRNDDRYERQESYVKDFKPLNVGTIELKRGVATLSLKAINIVGKEVMDFRLMILNRL